MLPAAWRNCGQSAKHHYVRWCREDLIWRTRRISRESLIARSLVGVILCTALWSENIPAQSVTKATIYVTDKAISDDARDAGSCQYSIQLATFESLRTMLSLKAQGQTRNANELLKDSLRYSYRDTLIIEIVPKLPAQSTSAKKAVPPLGSAVDTARARIMVDSVHHAAMNPTPVDAASESSGIKPANTKTTASGNADLVVLIDEIPSGDFKEGESESVFLYAPGDLEGKEVRIARKTSANFICATRISANPITLSRVGHDTTSFIADGAVATGLKSGGAANTITGSLGILHDSFKTPSEDRTCAMRTLRFFPFCTFPATGERLKAVIALTSSADTVLKSSSNEVYAQAVASPMLVSGQAGSTIVDWYRFHSRGGGTGTQGIRLIFSVTRASWAPDSVFGLKDETKNNKVLASDSIITHTGKSLSVIALDLRERVAFIDHISDAKGNSFGFGVDAGLIVRELVGGAAGNKSYLYSALRTNHRFFYGIVVAVDIRLRAVTASLEMPYLAHITGLFQPTFAFKFDAPFFTL